MKKTVLITGGTGGIGHTAALALAKKGHHVIIHGHNREKGKKVLENIQSQAKGKVHLISADISSIQGINHIANEVKKLTDKLDVFIHSTGTLNAQRKETVDGYDEGFVVNYLNKFILNQLLIEELKKGEGKIVIVGAPLLKNAKVHFEDLQLKNDYSLMKMMGQAMLCVHLYAQEFARRHDGHPVINVVHPGIVKTGIGRNLGFGMKFFFALLRPFIGNSPEKAIQNILYLVNENKESGYFYPKVGNNKVKEKLNYDPELAVKVWQESSKFYPVPVLQEI